MSFFQFNYGIRLESLPAVLPLIPSTAVKLHRHICDLPHDCSMYHTVPHDTDIPPLWAVNLVFPVLFPPPKSHYLHVDKRCQYSSSQDARDDEEVPHDTRLRLKLDIIIAHGTSLPLPTTLILPSVRPRVSRLVKMRHLLLVSKRIITRTHTTVRRLMMTKGISPWTLLMLRR